MTDTMTPQARSARMALIGSRDTKPEIRVRRLVHGMGYRYRLHATDLPGKPDLVFRPRRKAIFVHGCFWHSHRCGKYVYPKSRLEYWGPKLEKNRTRDLNARRQLTKIGWRSLVVWECQIRASEWLTARIRKFLED